ncbi:MAG: hypothetical protein L0J18_13320 [Tetragenococcus koreensis]|nr:hypothetical protein [Tetragenococcus koreensis]
MNLDFRNNQFDLFQDWTENDTKKKFTDELERQAAAERKNLPVILSTRDLRERWQMENRQSVHNYTKRNDFPDPALEFSNGKTKLYLESEVTIFEINHAWILTPESRKDYANWILKNVINK